MSKKTHLSKLYVKILCVCVSACGNDIACVCARYLCMHCG